MSGVWKNKDGVGQYTKVMHETIDVKRFDILGWAGAGNEVFVKIFVEATVKATGKTFKTDMLHNWTVNDAGLFCRFVEYCDTDAVVKAHQAG
ncbi:hypothetical protein KFL_001710120 [Klebsormidium nitens]|uniref:SnoaL-like domain-containing protein n=1 Tax=Klebsormidium nitens TaxID=105231 RepID=A0A1Y1I484_KLENI|nr:hypothetical protein KFL_001710120 [Klebsormidium nitens]|eukprot:GAQ83981.1 hypothetical protein KFL_001710120 [Klebsormidium nitens]